MSERLQYPAGVPCWVEVLQSDVQEGLSFYRGVFGWDIVGPGPMPGKDKPEYFVARLDGRDVAGIATAPAGVAPAWMTHIRVDSADAASNAAVAAGGALVAGPMDVLPAGRMAVLADPAGAGFCVWEAGERQGAQRINEPGAWAMSALQTTDVHQAFNFYAAVFGWRPEAFGPPEQQVSVMRLPGYVGGEPGQPVPRDVVAVVAGTAPGAGSYPNWGVDFWVKDADGTADEVQALGGRVLIEPSDTPIFRTAVLADPQGAVFSISQLLAG